MDNQLKYRIVVYMRIDNEPEDEILFDTWNDAVIEKVNLMTLQPENKYEIEEVD